jgi:hypothetical protein
VRDVTLSAPGYDSRRRVVAPTEGRSIVVEVAVCCARDGPRTRWHAAVPWRSTGRDGNVYVKTGTVSGRRVVLAPFINAAWVHRDAGYRRRRRFVTAVIVAATAALFLLMPFVAGFGLAIVPALFHHDFPGEQRARKLTKQLADSDLEY